VRIVDLRPAAGATVVFPKCCHTMADYLC
jgi:hypothetical protein